MKINLGVVELASNGQSSKGADRFKAETTVDGLRVFITVYGKPSEEAIVAPRKANNGRETAPTNRAQQAAQVAPTAAKPAQAALPGLGDVDMGKLVLALKALKAQGAF